MCKDYREEFLEWIKNTAIYPQLSEEDIESSLFIAKCWLNNDKFGFNPARYNRKSLARLIASHFCWYIKDKRIGELEEELNHLKTFVWNKDDDDAFRNCKSDNQKFMAYSIAKNLLYSEIEKVKELENQLAEKDALLKGQLEEIKNLHKRINEIVERDKKIITEQPKKIIEDVNLVLSNHIEMINTGVEIVGMVDVYDISMSLKEVLKEYSNEN